MKKNRRFIAVLACVVALPLAAYADDSIQFGGSVRTDDRVSTESTPQLTYQEYRLQLTGDAKPTDKARFHAEAWVRSSGTSSPATTADSLFAIGAVAPVTLDFREAYFELNGFIFDNVDLKIGRQRIAWGTADKLNPTDNVNPYDLEDIWDFGRHLGSDGVQLSVYAGGIQVTAVAIPVFTPAVLPQGKWATALMPSSVGQIPPGLNVTGSTTSLSLPSANLVDSITTGLRVKATVFDFDVSLSYLYARDSLPLVHRVVVTGAPPNVNVAADLLFPREHIIGADCAGSLFGVGVWAEAALFAPEKVTLTTDLSSIGYGVQQSTALDSTPYVKFVIGGDYTFPGNVYLNGQYLHGFVQERGASNLEDYFVFALDWKLLDDRLTISPLGVVVEIKNWRDIPDNYGILAAPSVSFVPVDNARLTIGLHLIQGTSSTTFGALSGNNEVFLQARYSF